MALETNLPIANNGITFTSDQDKAIKTIIEFINEDFDVNKIAIGLTGPGGVGKTFVTKYIINNCKYALSRIKCTSTTHKACRVFESAISNIKTVDTIQSTFGLRLDLKLEDFDPKNPQFNPMATPKLDGIKLLVVDESSMLPAKLVTFIYNKCKEHNIKILFIGDSSQLAPVNERESIAFKRCFTVCTLTQIVRQSNNNPLTDLLSLLRKDIDNNTHFFIEYIANRIGVANYNENGEGFEICDKQTFANYISIKFADEQYTKNVDLYKIVAYTNATVTAWNNYIRNLIIADSDKNIITKNDLIMSYETIVDEFNSPIIYNSEEYIINSIVDYVDSATKFKGFLVKFQAIHGGKITKPLFVLDHRDNFTIQLYHKKMTGLMQDAKNATGATRAGKWKAYFAFKKKYLLATNIQTQFGKILYQRDIDYGFAITSHKSQGSTYENVFVDANDMIFTKEGRIYTNQDDMLRRLYVACSRASKKLIICYNK